METQTSKSFENSAEPSHQLLDQNTYAEQMINQNKERAFCGHLGLTKDMLFGPPATNNIYSWFDERNVYYTHKARTAIRYACDLFKIKNGAEVLVPSYNCGSEIDPLIKGGATTVPYRIDKDCKIDLDDIVAKITNRTIAIFIIHYFGFPHDIEDVRNICRERKLYLMEDCALSLFSQYAGERVGSLGDVSFFSFPKTLSVPDGGALVINSPSLIPSSWVRRAPRYFSILRKLLSLLKSAALRTSPLFNKSYSQIRSITNYKIFHYKYNHDVPRRNMPGIPYGYYFSEKMRDASMSVITNGMLKRIDIGKVIKIRRDNFTRYADNLSTSACSNIVPLFRELPPGICPLSYPIIIKKRNSVCATLNNIFIDTTAWWSGYHKAIEWEKFPDACFLKDNLLVLPIHQDLDISCIDYISERLVVALQ